MIYSASASTPRFLHSAQRIVFAVLLLVLSSVVVQSTASAQTRRCEDSKCPGIKIYNETRYDFKLRFLLCCDGEQRVTDCYEVPAGGEVKFDFSPCTVLKYGFCNTLSPRVCTTWEDCVLKIHYCA